MTKAKKRTVATRSRAQLRTSRNQKDKTKAAAAKKRKTNISPEENANTIAPTQGKLATIIAMLRKAPGASIAALCDATGWQAHSVRGALSGTLKKKLGLKVVSVKPNDIRLYRIVD